MFRRSSSLAARMRGHGRSLWAGFNFLAVISPLLASPAAAQRVSQPSFTRYRATLAYRPAARADALGVGQEPRSVTLLAVGGLVGGAAGFFGGALAGSRIEESTGCGFGLEDCGLFGGFLGAFVGETLLLPLGVHIANGGRGNLAESYLAAVLIAGAGLGLSAASDRVEPMLLVPVAQLVTSILIERHGR